MPRQNHPGKREHQGREFESQKLLREHPAEAPSRVPPQKLLREYPRIRIRKSRKSPCLQGPGSKPPPQTGGVSVLAEPQITIWASTRSLLLVCHVDTFSFSFFILCRFFKLRASLVHHSSFVDYLLLIAFVDQARCRLDRGSMSRHSHESCSSVTHGRCIAGSLTNTRYSIEMRHKALASLINYLVSLSIHRRRGSVL